MVKLTGVNTLEIIDRGVRYHIEEVEEGGYFGQVVEVPGCITEGLTLDETVSNLREALALYVEEAEVDGIELPPSVKLARAAAS